MTYNIGNSSPGLGQVHKCGGVKPVNGIPNIPLLIIGSSTIQTNNKKKTAQICLHTKRPHTIIKINGINIDKNRVSEHL
jgi:hypothetical protein